MDPLRLLTQTDGFFTRREADEAGYDDRAVAAMVRSRVWTRFRRGYYAFTDEWTALDDVGRHRVRSRAVLRSLGPAVALSHVSAVIAHGIDVWGVPLDRVHVTRLDGGAGRDEAGVVHHVGVCLDGDVTMVGGLQVTTAARSVLEAGTGCTSEAALCLFDSGLFKKRFDLDELHRLHQRLGDWPGMQHLHVPVRMATPKSQSIGETRGRWLFRCHHLPAPLTQLEVCDAAGKLLGICDWGWPELGLLGEFDGRIKYGRLLRPGEDPGEVVFAEKVREDKIREATGCGMVRLIWADYDRPHRTAARVERLLGRTT
ncbi:type IV toxin-antitoxin system AbiEi family antitoxin domain-containing protein [Nocardioides sp. SR21]|uniref:type IV toxin-antitoxin system AbiEi family antitoxin domain-containing protein n=1 Tax=Nocardioides sp. SR21 TaxID=2919501 RepID=UPI001FAAC2C6|nr:type IV toxin-antitoxin system AbiEi family antitoxin domain-containing protein [Nocardioides sp. SR21]